MKAVPFVIGQWVRGDRFYGRTRLIEEILTGPRDALWVVGTRRIGKTSLLKQLEHLVSIDPKTGYVPLFWDLQGADEPSELHAGFSEALLDSEERLQRLEIDVDTVDAGDLFTSLRKLRRALKARGFKLLLLCDEVEELLELHLKEPALLRKLRHALQASDDVRSVLASTIRLWDLTEQREDTSPFLHGISPPLFISRLTEEEGRSLVAQKNLGEDLRPPFSDAEIEAIREACDDHPYLLQLVAKRFLETGKLEQTIDQVASDSMVSYFFSVDFDMLDSGERSILRSLASATTPEDRSEVESEASRTGVQRLLDLGLLRRTAGGRLDVAGFFLARWLNEIEPASADATPIMHAQRSASLGHGSLTSTPGTTVIDDRYELRREVGSGATGIVFEAFDRLLRARIAVKILRREFAGNASLLERFRKEILLARNLGHPNILRVYHLGQFENRAYITMQWIDGGTLADAISARGALPAERVALLGVRLASALEAAHAHKVLHRDIKPQNILLEASGEPLITDFGLARLLADPGQTTTGMFLGTPNYVSPEQASLRPLDERSDIYSLGVVLYEMATGRCPFIAGAVDDVLEMHRSLEPPDPRDVAPGLDREMSALILRCLEKGADDRFASAGELRRALENLLPGKQAPPHAHQAVSDLGGPEDRPPSSPEDLLPLVYDELRRLARGFLSRERPGHTLEPTALVHEAYMRLANQSRMSWQGRTHFLAVGAKVMRRVLIDHARGRARLKRGGDRHRITFIEGLTPAMNGAVGFDELLTLDRALEELAAINSRQADIVELRFFSGMTVAEVADHLGVSKRTVESDWTAAREWLLERLSSQNADETSRDPDAD
jgi:RNA polymerase sigma factor (TIGR02999 family)